MDSSTSTPWPLLDFNKFPDQMISGLTIEEINEYVNFVDDDQNSFLDLLCDDTHDTTHQVINAKNPHFSNAVSDGDLERSVNDQVPLGTKRRNRWAISLYEKWFNQRKITDGDDKTIKLPNLQDLVIADSTALDYWLSKFIFEVRRQDCNPYPCNTLISVVAGLNSYFSTHQRSVNLFTDDAFCHFREILDAACKVSSKARPSCSSRQAEVISESEEETMWSQGILGDKDPETLIHTLLFLNGLHFALRSGQEHRSLTTDQLKISPPNSDSKYFVIEYTETVSKTYNGGLKHRRLDPKKVRHVDINSIENPPRSHALLLQKYQAKRPTNSSNVFYLTPNKSVNGSWYKMIPMGHNVLINVVKNLCRKSGISGYKTNHSLRATCATRLYQGGVDEQVIMERTGHRSTKGVRSYKRTSNVHHHNSSVIIDNKSIKNETTSNGNNVINFHFHSGSNVVINN